MDRVGGYTPAKTTISGMPAISEAVPSEPSVSSMVTVDRTASTSFFNDNLRSVSTINTSQPNSSLLSYLTAKLAKIKDTRSKKSVTGIKPRKTTAKTNAVSSLEASDSVSVISETASEASDTEWDELPIEASGKPSGDLEKGTKLFVPRSTRTSPISTVHMSRVRREVSNPEMKKISELSEMSNESGSFLKGVPEDEMEVSKISENLCPC